MTVRRSGSRDPGRRARRPDVSWAAAERALVTRARWRISLLVALAVTALIGLVGATAYAELVNGQQVQIERELAYSALRHDPARAASCTWLFVRTGDRIATGAYPAPAGFPQTAAMDQAARTGATLRSTVVRDGTEYHVLTQRWDGGTVQAVFDARYQLDDRQHLLRALLSAELFGLLAAATTGILVGRRTVEPLAEALSRQRRFVTDASHELRTPIAQVHTRAQLLARRARRDDLPAAHRTELDRLVGTTRLLGEIVDDLLLSARLSAAAARFPTDPVDLVALAEATVAGEADRAAQQGVTIVLNVPSTPVVVPGIASALRRVAGELLANALAHTPSGGLIDVTVSATASGPRRRPGRAAVAELVVSDTGTGFDPADAHRLFDRFHRGEPGTSGRRCGLGLALLREVVTGHGGSIEATGTPGRGATFTVRLPALPVPSPYTLDDEAPLSASPTSTP